MPPDPSSFSFMKAGTTDTFPIATRKDTRKYWMVLGAVVPVYRHTTLESAKAEAERLARANRNCDFTVLEAVSRCRVSDVSWDELVDHKEVPF